MWYSCGCKTLTVVTVYKRTVPMTRSEWTIRDRYRVQVVGKGKGGKTGLTGSQNLEPSTSAGFETHHGTIGEGCKKEIFSWMRRSLSRNTYIKWSVTVLLFLNIVSVIQLRRVRRAERVARMEEFILVDNSGEKSGKKHWGDLENDGKNILWGFVL